MLLLFQGRDEVSRIGSADLIDVTRQVFVAKLRSIDPLVITVFSCTNISGNW